MVRRTIWVAGAAALLILAGCNKAQSPEKVQNDVTNAANSAAENDAKAAQQQANAESSATNDVEGAKDKADAKVTSAAADAALTEAEGKNKVALAQCEALSGDLQQACKDKANADLDVAKANVKRMKAAGSGP
jgi:vacuolar-type H+-ATPase subunit H